MIPNILHGQRNLRSFGASPAIIQHFKLSLALTVSSKHFDMNRGKNGPSWHVCKSKLINVGDDSAKNCVGLVYPQTAHINEMEYEREYTVAS